MKKFSIPTFIVLLMLNIILVTTGCKKREQKINTVNGRQNPLYSELRVLVLDEIAVKAPSGSVVSHLTDVHKDSKEAIDIWIIRDGKAVPGTIQDLQQAFGSNRSRWPPKTYLFSVESYIQHTAIIRVQTHYDKGISPKSRGGNEKEWTLIKDLNGWKILEKELIAMWD